MMLPDPNLPIGWEPEEVLTEDWMPIQDLMVLPDPNLPTFWEPTETLPEGWMPRQGPMMLPEPNLPTGWDPDESLPEGWKSMSNLRVVSDGDVINDIDDIDGQGSVPSTTTPIKRYSVKYWSVGAINHKRVDSSRINPLAM